MLNVLKVRISQGSQYIPDLRGGEARRVPRAPGHRRGGVRRRLRRLRRGLPDAGDRARARPARPRALRLLHRTAWRRVRRGRSPSRRSPGWRRPAREALILREGPAAPPAIAVAAELTRLFGRSLKLRSVSAGGCNGCELELNALGNVNFDLERYGIEWVASPRHADALVISGPLTRNMAEAVQLAWDGDARAELRHRRRRLRHLGRSRYGASTQLDRSFLDRFAPSLYVPGCPPHPLTFVNGILDLLGIDLRRTP